MTIELPGYPIEVHQAGPNVLQRTNKDGYPTINAVNVRIEIINYPVCLSPGKMPS